MSKFKIIEENLKLKTKNSDGVFIFLPKVSNFQQKEIDFHNYIHQDEEEIHQLNAIRNTYYHNYFKKSLYQLPKDSVILEIGAGAGFDALQLLKRGYRVIISDISFESIKSIKLKIDSQYPQYKNQIIYLVADGENLPFFNDSIDAVYLVATLHHLENLFKAIQELKRVTKKNAQIIFAMEPSRFMMWFTKLFNKSKQLRIHDGYSEADDIHLGYTKKDLNNLINNKSLIIKIKRVWLFLGFLHYGLEAIFRIFKLKKRIKIPQLIEWLLLTIDEVLSMIPFLNKLNWHWIIIIKNND